MQLKRIVLEVRFKDIARSFNWRAQLAQGITGNASAPSLESPINEGLEINIAEGKTKVQIQSRRFALVIDDCSDRAEMKMVIDRVMQRVYNAVGWQTMLRIGVRTIWVEEFDGTLDALIRKLRERNFADNAIVNQATDVAVTLTLRDGENSVNYISGPMSKEELATKYSINDDNGGVIPDVILVVDSDYSSATETSFSKNKVVNFFEKAVDYGKDIANKTHDVSFGTTPSL